MPGTGGSCHRTHARASLVSRPSRYKLLQLSACHGFFVGGAMASASSSFLDAPYITAPPPGVTPNFDPGDLSTLQIEFIAAYVITAVLAGAALVLRMYTRFAINRSPGYDDGESSGV